MSTQVFQCRLRRGVSEQVAWIPARAAKVGLSVELLPSKEFWDVVEVFKHGLEQADLKEHQRLNRNSLPSVKGMR